MARNIVVFSDGTGQEGGKGSNSNVYKLFNMVENRTDKQVTFYDRGLGTGWRKLSGQVAGMGISRNIKECYRFIFDEYRAGDQVYLFGFSRGATTVRSLSSFIHLFGVLPKSRPELIDQAYRIYRISDRQKRDRRAAAFVAKHHTMWCRIRFLGAWDTVAALGIPVKALNAIINAVPFFRYDFQDLRLSESVEHARHALAIDDEREIFHPVIWAPDLHDHQTLDQVWFCGVHTDIGGGYPEQGLSDIALEWMRDEAVRFGLRIFPGQKVTLSPNPDGVMHDSRAKGAAPLYRKRIRSWDVDKNGAPVVHESVLLRTLSAKDNNATTGYSPWILKRDYNIRYAREE
ncbi:MAG: DUF2235 domain-containing protein [Gammaproteobacteria bacterium]|nr:DUF2235 domain-containing protein [Gammaproteobacteria bacterium]